MVSLSSSIFSISSVRSGIVKMLLYYSKLLKNSFSTLSIAHYVLLKASANIVANTIKSKFYTIPFSSIEFYPRDKSNQKNLKNKFETIAK